jgi:sortase A
VRRALRITSTVLIVAGALLLLDAGLTVAWQEPVSALYAQVNQDRLGGDLDELERVAPSPVEARALRRLGAEPERRVPFLARALRRRVDAGDALGRLSMPRLGIAHVAVDGTRAAELRRGPGFYEGNPLPGTGGTVAVAGHRTTYGAPFRRIDELRRGDRVVVTMPYGRFEYRVERTRIVAPSATWVVRRTDHERLVLTACHPLYSAAQRIVVFARLARSEPRGAARA